MQTKSEVKLLSPLHEFYEGAGLPLPVVSLIDGGQMPQPYRRLLVHERDMTPTLEAAYGQTIHLKVLQHALHDGVFSRQVLLVLEDGVTPVEFGGIKIYLDPLPPEAKRLVLERRTPLGSILRTQRIAHHSRPAAYLQMTADAVISEAFELKRPCVLYGRCNVLSDLSQRPLARVVEILPPVNGTPLLEDGFE
jgi:chorismate-pyruvate lyase